MIWANREGETRDERGRLKKKKKEAIAHLENATLNSNSFIISII